MFCGDNFTEKYLPDNNDDDNEHEWRAKLRKRALEFTTNLISVNHRGANSLSKTLHARFICVTMEADSVSSDNLAEYKRLTFHLEPDLFPSLFVDVQWLTFFARLSCYVQAKFGKDKAVKMWTESKPWHSKKGGESKSIFIFTVARRRHHAQFMVGFSIEC